METIVSIISDKPCIAMDRDENPICEVHHAYWSRRQDYCEVLLSRHPELRKP